MAVSVVVLNEKGGVGKTMIACSLAAGLAARGLNVCLIDADGQGHSTKSFGFEKEPGFYHAAVKFGQPTEPGEQPFDVRTWLRPISPDVFAPPDVDTFGKLYLLPGDSETKWISEHAVDGLSIHKLVDYLSQSFDFIVFDTGPAPSVMQAMVLIAADGIIIPTKPEYLSFDGVVEAINHIRQSNLAREKINRPRSEIVGIVPNMVRKRTVEHQENMNMLREQFGALVWDEVPQYTALTEVTTFRASIFNIAPRSRAASACWRIVDRLMEVYSGEKA